MQPLNLPEYNFRIRQNERDQEIFDMIRHKFVALTPEEWVRQNFIRYLVEEKKIPAVMLAVEKSLTLNKLTKRTDILVFGDSGKPLMIVECKSPTTAISQKVFEQIGRYNLALKVSYLAVTNGLQHYCARIDLNKNTFAFLKEIPEYGNMKKD